MALYPPIVASSMPAFNINLGKVRVYYTLSSYNTNKKDEIKYVHVSVRRQSSNVNILKNGDIVIKTFGLQDPIDKILNRYYIQISNNDLEENFQQDVLYKVQLRFSAIAEGSSASDNNFYSSNISKLSQWSTVCIIRPIVPPLFYIDELFVDEQHYPPSENDNNSFFNTLADFTGIYKPKRSDETKDSNQALREWRLRLLTSEYTEQNQQNILNIEKFTLADSGWVLNKISNYDLSDNSAILTCSLPYEMSDEESYKLRFDIQTKNGYIDHILYNFKCQKTNINKINGDFTVKVNEEEGYIKVEFEQSNNNENSNSGSDFYTGNVLLRRSDARSNFQKWEDLKYFECQGQKIHFTYYDFTAQSGMFYNYLVQKVNLRGRKGTPTKFVDPKSNSSEAGVLTEWNHAFLLQSANNDNVITEDGSGSVFGVKQLKLKYDLQISSYKTNISESKTDTIGSQYPYIRRNGNMYYRSFPITGTITEFMDDADLFTNSQQLFYNNFDKYQIYRGYNVYQTDQETGEEKLLDTYLNHVNQYDYTYERKFREKVEEFLYNSKPKLYKSTQEGNIFIKLMQVSLTPKNELGRLIYSFSATAYEIGEPSLENFNKYNIISVGELNPQIKKTTSHYMQVGGYSPDEDANRIPFPAGVNIIGTDSTSAAGSVADALRYNSTPFDSTVNDENIVNDFTIKYIRLEMESDPYLIKKDTQGNLIPFDDTLEGDNSQDELSGSVIQPLYQIQSKFNSNTSDSATEEQIYLGWVFSINGQDILISYPNNIYQIREDNLTLSKNTSIIPKKDTVMSVNFYASRSQIQDVSKVAKYETQKRINAQLIGTYTKETELISQIQNKHSLNYNNDKGKIKNFISGIHSVLIDADPNTVIEMKTSSMSEPQKYVINFTGQLNFNPESTDISINSLKILGMRVPVEQLHYVDSNLNFYTDGDYNEDTKEYYYKNQWYPVDDETWEDNFIIVEYPIDVLVFYYATVKEEVY